MGFQLIIDATLKSSLFGQIVIALLIGFSITSWAVVGMKARAFNVARRQNQKFEALFDRAEGNFSELYEKAMQFEKSPMAVLFREGWRELRALGRVENRRLFFDRTAIAPVERALGRSQLDVLHRLEHRLIILATTANACPFLGLLGTVWGILSAFQAIGISGSARLDVVGPQIGEALVATAIGLLAAIPAAMAYNYFQSRLASLETELSVFGSRFLGILERNVSPERPPSASESVIAPMPRVRTTLSRGMAADSAAEPDRSGAA